MLRVANLFSLFFLLFLSSMSRAGVPPDVISYSAGDGGVKDGQNTIVVEIEWESARRVMVIETIGGANRFKASVGKDGVIRNSNKEVGSAWQMKSPSGRYSWHGKATVQIPVVKMGNNNGVSYSFKLIDATGQRSKTKHGQHMVSNWVNDATPDQIEKIDVNSLVRLVQDQGCAGYTLDTTPEMGTDTAESEQVTDSVEGEIGLDSVLGDASSNISSSIDSTIQTGIGNVKIGPIINQYYQDQGISESASNEIIDQVAANLRSINREPEITEFRKIESDGQYSFSVSAVDDSCIAYMKTDVLNRENGQSVSIADSFREIRSATYHGTIELGEIPAGKYKVTVVVVDGGGKADNATENIEKSMGMIEDPVIFKVIVE